MASLSNPTIQVEEFVDPLTGQPNNTDYRVTGTVNIQLSTFETNLVTLLGLPLQLNSDVWGEDTGDNDDFLFSFTSQNVTGSGTYTFSRTIPRQTLDEDNVRFFDNRDEVYEKFNLVSGSNVFPVNITTNSLPLLGYFGLNP